MRKITHIIIHCSDSKWGDAEIINQWHKERGFSQIGYHWVILNGFRNYRALKSGKSNPADDGIIEPGRLEGTLGSHCLGYNDRSVGVCLVGEGKYTDAQIKAAVELVNGTREFYGIPISNVLGHCETPKCRGKTCPNMNMAVFRRKLLG